MKSTILNELSEQLLLLVKSEKPTSQIVSQLEAFPLNKLRKALVTDEQKKAFWINSYNAFFQLLRKDYGLARPDIFRQKIIRIASLRLSLDDIEHGILRRFRTKWSLGYLSNPWPPAQLKKLAVSQVDYRIHFALNCGAKSCPPIASYTPKKLDAQLDLAMLSFLESETEVLNQLNEIRISRLFLWFRADFGGTRGIKEILNKNLGINCQGKKLSYKPYDWQEELDKYGYQSEKLMT